MRPVVLQIGITLDGFVHGAKGTRTGAFQPRRMRSWRGR